MNLYLNNYYTYYQKFHNIFCRDKIRADQKCKTEIGVGILYYFIINHIPYPTAKKIS